jgi:hypothetical protein
MHSVFINFVSIDLHWQYMKIKITSAKSQGMYIPSEKSCVISIVLVCI